MTQDTSDAPTPSIVDEALNDTNSPGKSGQGDNTVIEIQKLQEEINQLRDQLARSQADYSNMVRRNREESAQIGEWSENKIIIKFLPILDNLERALEHTPTEFQSHTWMEGITSIVRSMQKVLTDLGVVRMNCVGQEINPDLHDVISQIPHTDTTIQSEIENGYIRNEKAIRHAKVIVGDGSLS